MSLREQKPPGDQGFGQLTGALRPSAGAASGGCCACGALLQARSRSCRLHLWFSAFVSFSSSCTLLVWGSPVLLFSFPGRQLCRSVFLVRLVVIALRTNAVCICPRCAPGSTAARPHPPMPRGFAPIAPAKVGLQR